MNVSYEQLKQQPLYKKVAFECGEGWFPLLNCIAMSIQSHLQYKELPIEAVRIAQIKEKFGTLRFYWGLTEECPANMIEYIYPFIDGVVSMAEYVSETTCEQCGNQGELRNTRWRSVLCDEHFKERTEEQ